MKKIIINERQERKLVIEAMQEGFSLAVFDSLPRENKIKYLNKYLGEKIGMGMGRVVYEISDDSVLKYCYWKDNKQNEQEYLNYKSVSENYPYLSSMFTKVYQVADDFSWIICEKVLAFDKNDSREVLGLPYNDKNYPSLVGFIDWAEQKVNGSESDGSYEEEEYERLVSDNEWFGKLYKYIELNKGESTDLIDDNFGLAIRNGNPYIVILDSGMEKI